MRIYFAGKVTKGGGYREALFSHRVMDRGEFGFIQGRKEYTYVGPFAIGCDHGCFHNGKHGLVSNGCGCGTIGDVTTTGFNEYEAVRRCLSQIDSCDVLYAYLSCATGYGTISEIAWALGKGKRVIIEVEKQFSLTRQYRDLWFLLHFPMGIVNIVHGPNWYWLDKL